MLVLAAPGTWGRGWFGCSERTLVRRALLTDWSPSQSLHTQTRIVDCTTNPENYYNYAYFLIELEFCEYMMMNDNTIFKTKYPQYNITDLTQDCFSVLQSIIILYIIYIYMTISGYWI